MDPKITEKLQAFVNADEKDRDYKDGAMLLLKISGNRVEYRNNIDHLDTKKQHILKRLSQYLQFRLLALTKEQVAQLKKDAEKIVNNVPKEVEKMETGKRKDHDSLPEEIQALYIENRDILHKQQQLHLKIRTLALNDAPCPESEIFPFVKEIVDLDKKRLANWKKYDSFASKENDPSK